MPPTITILDGYTDEPSCLGVPPFIAPLPRYVFGAVRSVRKDFEINYLTIDEYRQGSVNKSGSINEKFKRLLKSNLLIIIAGAVVPGKYLRGTPISFRETMQLAYNFSGKCFLGGACARFGFKLGNSRVSQRTVQKQLENVFDFICTQDLDAAVFDFCNDGTPQNRSRTVNECNSWANIGAEVVRQHPDYPNLLVAELEVGRGCVRYFIGGCSFCYEPQFGTPEFRQPEDIAEESKQLSNLGITHFRLGGVSCIFSYHATGIGESETPTPNPKMVDRLLNGIRNSAPNLNVLHLDNANPAVMAAHVKESTIILKIIIKNCTGGNVLSFGLESADPKVIEANNLNTTPEEVIEMITLVNQYGAKQSNTGLPELLPGLNFIYGLMGESKETFRLNFEFLKSILDKRLLLRRINLRQVLDITFSNRQKFNIKKFHHEFIKHKKLVREHIDRPMLKRLIPFGTLLKDIYTEKILGNITFGRQLGTYPILIGIPYNLALKQFYNIVITEYGYRSITGFVSPFNINTASSHALEALPGFGKKRAIRILKTRPFKNMNEFKKALDDPSIINQTKKHLIFDNI